MSAASFDVFQKSGSRVTYKGNFATADGIVRRFARDGGHDPQAARIRLAAEVAEREEEPWTALGIKGRDLILDPQFSLETAS